MLRLKIRLFQVSFFFILLDELSQLQNGAIKVDAKIIPKFGCLNTTISLHCKQPEVMKIVRAFFHREQGQVCSTGKDDGNNAVYCQPVDKISLASDSCDGKVYCDISVNYTTISDDCRTISPYLTVLYTCEMPILDSNSTNILTTSIISSTPRTTNGPGLTGTTSTAEPESHVRNGRVNHGFITYGGASICKHHGFLAGSLLFLLLF
ncbi:uncharacterized protein LOC114975268 isoform X1 [Acropora millepora]|uniref:uncharacterized protein LOC114975268 isoform X1 n=1 Tax=Acropora millepora TaxID=45264 RepID=UPI001CF27B1D|nr:uncharacterized protein LOC114975268 isoform X1 [Acropora millepora]